MSTGSERAPDSDVDVPDVVVVATGLGTNGKVHRPAGEEGDEPMCHAGMKGSRRVDAATLQPSRSLCWSCFPSDSPLTRFDAHDPHPPDADVPLLEGAPEDIDDDLPEQRRENAEDAARQIELGAPDPRGGL